MTSASYEGQLECMLANGKAWCAANPEKIVQLQFNFPKTVCVVASISDALQNHFVSANEAGLELIKALAPWDCPEEPTVLMVRVVLENLSS